MTGLARGTAKIEALIAEITTAPNDQAQGIDHVNRAAIEMNKVVQRVAANAEESASASEVMPAQADPMKQYVSGLVALTGAKGDGGLITTSKELVQQAFQGMKEKRRYVKNRLIAPHREEFETEQMEEVHPK